MRWSNKCLKKLATKQANVCCDGPLLAHSANLIILTLWSIVIKYFGEAVLPPPHRLLRTGSTALLPPSPFSYTSDVIFFVICCHQTREIGCDYYNRC